ncbi:MAG: flagellar biosynthesis anti-sigma factor FlgM [Spirochaetaceae bacterium]|jgi:anti-sigma28 factor (negative regulator of flagellin synthesis)|nr:flagellar biosynthesis anti-sigma factor FlgM [Spirochaetaceae bacterium]
MTIEKLGGINPLNGLDNAKRPKNASGAPGNRDVINVSEEGLKKAEAYYLAEIASATSDVRAELVERIKEKIKDPGYISAAVIDSTASKIMDAYGL